MTPAGAPSAEDRIEAVRAALLAVADSEKAPEMAAYMKNRFAFFGVQTKDRRAAQRPALTSLADEDGDGLIRFARACWRQDEREFQYVGADALRKHEGVLESRHLTALAELITDKSWWDTVDSLATNAVGPLVARNPELVADMDRWIESDDIWLARSAILHQLHYKDRTDADRLFAYADRRAGDTEFFIRKALGWALRQYARTDPEAVRRYVADRGDRLSGLTRREALKHL